MNPNYSYSTTRRALPLKPILLVGGLIATVITAVIFVFSAANSEPTQQIQRLSARITTLKSIIDVGSKYAQGGDLRKINSDASILVTNEKAILDEYFIALGAEKIDKNIAALEADTATLETLENAKLNGRFDGVYPTTLAQKLESTIALIREVRDKTRRVALKDQLTKTEAALSTVLDQLAALNQ